MMKLSDAIRLGAMIRPQGFGSYFDGKSCALDAAYEAAGGTFWTLEAQWGLLSCVLHPVDKAVFTLHYVVTSLNDRYRWTREDIADQVEMWEREYEAKSANTSPVRGESRESAELLALDWANR